MSCSDTGRSPGSQLTSSSSVSSSGMVISPEKLGVSVVDNYSVVVMTASAESNAHLELSIPAFLVDGADMALVPRAHNSNDSGNPTCAPSLLLSSKELSTLPYIKLSRVVTSQTRQPSCSIPLAGRQNSFSGARNEVLADILDFAGRLQPQDESSRSMNGVCPAVGDTHMVISATTIRGGISVSKLSHPGEVVPCGTWMAQPGSNG